MAGTIDFKELASQIAEQEGLSPILPVIEKELLHYEILRALEKEALLDQLVFQGGTCLRLCYGSVRYSEDLDFACKPMFDVSDFAGIADLIRSTLTKRYDVEVTVKEPSPEGKLDESGVILKRWRVDVVTARKHPDIPLQRIKIEVAEVPAYTRAVRSLMVNYLQLPPSYANILLYAESLEEIAADKLVSLASASRLRYRDIWDLRWISSQPRLKTDEIGAMVDKKVIDYRSGTSFAEGRERILASLPDIIASKGFLDQMARFLPRQVRAETLDREMFCTHLADEVTRLYELTR